MENPPQDFGYPVNPGNVVEGQGSQTSTRKLVGTTHNPEVECSQLRRQENAQNSDSWKQGDQEESSNSACSRTLVRAATPRTEFQNMKFTDNPYMTKVFHFLQKKFGITGGYSSLSMKHWRQKCVNMEIAHVYVTESTHSSWTELFGEPGVLQEHELSGNSELVQYHAEIDIVAFWRDSECTYDSQLFSVLDEISIVSWSSDPVDKSRCTCLIPKFLSTQIP